MNMTVNTLQRCFDEGRYFIKAAGEYKRSTKAIIIQAVVGLLTGGIGAIAIEIYHAANRASKRSDFKEFAGKFLEAAKDRVNNNSFTVEFNKTTITIAKEGDDVIISSGEEKATVENDNINEMRGRLAYDIVTNYDQYHQDTIRIALNYSDNKARNADMASALMKKILGEKYYDLTEVCYYLAEDEIAELALDALNNPRDMECKFEELQKQFKKVYDSVCDLDNSKNERPNIIIRYADNEFNVEAETVSYDYCYETNCKNLCIFRFGQRYIIKEDNPLS